MQRPAGNNVAEEATKPAPTEHVSFSADSIKSVVHEQLDSASNLTAAARHNIFKAGTAVWTTVKQPLTEVVQMIRNANSPATGTPLRKSIADVRVAASNTLVSVEVANLPTEDLMAESHRGKVRGVFNAIGAAGLSAGAIYGADEWEKLHEQKA
ncbi:hypothetical protein DYB32_000168 [Aphanomyces invadans]|uniref:Uncharacterized protein n=1 Tax=Aphanomyces invadans TaxID=157072 RepID=A0A3R6VIP1_9STRA|nr:hypothetical protein DYB32_000168 [Aphanomyces invadans]